MKVVSTALWDSKSMVHATLRSQWTWAHFKPPAHAAHNHITEMLPGAKPLTQIGPIMTRGKRLPRAIIVARKGI